jgi:hypothetical protein
MMGFHPDNGEELRPITKEIVEIWKTQSVDRRPVDRRLPQRVNPAAFSFFDQLSGEPRAWYWGGPDGTYEFYDSPGYQPRTGDKLSVVTQGVLDVYWKGLRERAEKEELKNRELAAREEGERRDREAVQLCDQLAANPTDRRRVGNGLTFELLASKAKGGSRQLRKGSTAAAERATFPVSTCKSIAFCGPETSNGDSWTACQSRLSCSF